MLQDHLYENYDQQLLDFIWDQVTNWHTQNTTVNEKFCCILITWNTIGKSRHFCWGHEGDKPYWTVWCQAHLILYECYSSDLPVWLWAQPQNLHFLAYLTSPDHWHSYNPSKISFTIWLLYCDQLNLHFLHSKCFSVVSTSWWPTLNLYSISFWIRLHCTFICVAFKSHTVK